jgi:hypothetical protein
MKKVTDEQINDMVTDLIKAMETDMPAAAESYKPINRYINLPMDDKDDMDIVCRYGLRVYQMPLDLQPDASISYVEDYRPCRGWLQSVDDSQNGKEGRPARFPER